MLALLVALIFAPFGIAVIERDIAVSAKVATVAYGVMAVIAVAVAWS